MKQIHLSTFKLSRSEEKHISIIEWVEELPDLEQPDVFREIAVIWRERYEKTGDKECLKKSHFN